MACRVEGVSPKPKRLEGEPRLIPKKLLGQPPLRRVAGGNDDIFVPRKALLEVAEQKLECLPHPGEVPHEDLAIKTDPHLRSPSVWTLGEIASFWPGVSSLSAEHNNAIFYHAL